MHRVQNRATKGRAGWREPAFRLLSIDVSIRETVIGPVAINRQPEMGREGVGQKTGITGTIFVVVESKEIEKTYGACRVIHEHTTY